MEQPLSHHLDDAAAALPAQALRGSRDARVFLPLTIAGVALGCLSLLPGTPGLVWNFSESVPVGLYRIERTASTKADIVALAPVGRLRDAIGAYGILPPGRMLLKSIAAGPGDTVCRSADTITINGEVAAHARGNTRDGRALPTWSGCYLLQDSDIFVLAPHPASFDGRYFGPIDVSQVVGVAHPVFTLPPARETL